MAAVQPDVSVTERMAELKGMLESGLITQADFEAKKAELLRQL